MEGSVGYSNDLGNSYAVLIGQLILEELKCIRKEVKEEVRRIADKFQDYLEATKSVSGSPSNLMSHLDVEHDNDCHLVAGPEQTSPLRDIQTKVKLECLAQVDESFPQSTIDLTECLQDIKIPDLPQQSSGSKEREEKEDSWTQEKEDSWTPEKEEDGLRADEDLPIASEELILKSCNSVPIDHRKLLNGKRTRKSFPRKLNVNSESSSSISMDGSGEEDAASQEGKSTDDESTQSGNSSDEWLQYVIIQKNLYHCKVCRQNFTNRSSLKRHCRIHTGDKPYRCNVCFGNFPRPEELRLHKKREHDGLPDNVEVKSNVSSDNDGQPDDFSTRAKFDKKISTLKFQPSSNKRSTIALLGNTYITNNSPEIHALQPAKRASNLHNVKFVLPPHHRKNLIMKNDRKFYYCDICFKSFVYTSQSYRRHMMIHTGERPFKCDFCNKGFIRAANLKMHVRVHTGEKPYKCHLCGKQFRMRSGLTTHLKSVHSTDADFVHWV